MRQKTLRRIFCIFLIAALCAPLFSAYKDMSRGALKEGAVCLRVEPGSGTDKISQQLQKTGLIRYPLLFKAVMRLTGQDERWQPVNAQIPAGSGYAQIAEKLTRVPQKPDVKVLIREGLQLKEIAKVLEDAGICGRQEFLDACQNSRFDYPFLEGTYQEGRRALEGYLFPDTYRFFPDSDPARVIDAMLRRFEEMVYTPQNLAAAESAGLSFDQIITLASIVESEAALESDRRQIADVFLKRLRYTEYGKLQSCVTVEYALGIHKSILSHSDTLVDSPYNTYLHAGLPIGPICCPGAMSVDAALHPEENSYYYFQSDRFGRIWFAETYAEHSRIAKEIQKDWTVITRIVGE